MLAAPKHKDFVFTEIGSGSRDGADIMDKPAEEVVREYYTGGAVNKLPRRPFPR